MRFLWAKTRVGQTIRSVPLLLIAYSAGSANGESGEGPNRHAPPAQATEKLLLRFFQDSPAEQAQLERIDIPIEDERSYGRQLLESYLDQLRQERIHVIRHGRDFEYVRELLRDLRPQMRRADRYRTIQLYLADDRLTDARAFPGGFVVLHRGMLDLVRSEAALAGVLAHELAHIDRGHQLEMWKRSKLMANMFSGASLLSPADAMVAGQSFAKQFARPFRPEHEQQADEDAVRILVATEYDPREMVRLFEQLHQRDRQQPTPLPGFLRSHPYHEDRARAAEDTINQLVPAERLGRLHVGKQNLRRRIPCSRKVMDVETIK